MKPFEELWCWMHSLIVYRESSCVPDSAYCVATCCWVHSLMVYRESSCVPDSANCAATSCWIHSLIVYRETSCVWTRDLIPAGLSAPYQEFPNVVATWLGPFLFRRFLPFDTFKPTSEYSRLLLPSNWNTEIWCTRFCESRTA